MRRGSRQHQTAYAIAQCLPGYEVIGLRGWDDFIVRNSVGEAYSVPTVPIVPEHLSPFSLPRARSLSCPVAIAGRHHPIGLYEAIPANAVTYALVGLIVETLRHQLHHAK
jgi:hypothetical protein